MTRALIILLMTTTVASAGQMLAPGPGGLRYSRPFATAPYYRGVAPGPYYRGAYPRPYYRSDAFPVAPLVAGAIAGAVLPRLTFPQPMPPPPRAIAAPPPDALDEVAPVNPQGITREEVGNALNDWCAEPRNAQAPLCVKMGDRIQR
jgi:hypothetical protein